MAVARMMYVALVVLFLLVPATIADAKQVEFDKCGSDDHLGVTSVDISPYPAHPGDALKIVVNGTNDIDIQEGTIVSMAVSESGIPVPTKTFDLCASLSDKVNCPVKSGTTSTATFTYNVPRIAFPGTARSKVTTTDKSGQVLSCITLDIEIEAQDTPASF